MLMTRIVDEIDKTQLQVALHMRKWLGSVVS